MEKEMNMEQWTAWFPYNFVAGISVTNWSIALAVAAGSFCLMLAVLAFVLQRLEAIKHRTTSHIDDLLASVLAGTSKLLLAVAALLIGLGMLDLSPRWNDRVDQLWFIAFTVQMALWLNRGISLATHRHLATNTSEVFKASATATLMVWGLRVMLWSVVLLAILSNLGVNITALVASLGVGGIAVALAVQNILGDLFASLSIAVDKPFELGDFIVMGDVMGSVEQVGLKTTRLRSLGGEQIILSNAELLKATIRNYKRMAERRILFGIGLTYDATPEQIETVTGIIKRAVEAQEKTRFDRAHFKAFGSSSLDFEVVYFVLDPGFSVYMDIQQAINLTLMREFKALGVEFAFPTQTLHLVRPSVFAGEGAGRGEKTDYGDGNAPLVRRLGTK